MPLEEKETEETAKNQGGKTMTDQEIQSIALAVKNMLAEDKEKETVGQQLTEVREEVGELKGEFGKVKEGMHCTPDGKYCFRTPQGLSDFMEKQATKMEGIEAKIGEVVSQVKGIGQAGKKETLPGGVQRLPDVTAEIRAGMSEMDNEARDLEVKAIADHFRVSDNDLYRRVEKNPVNLDVIAKKKNMRKRVFDGITDQELKDVTLMACKDGKCKPFREGMEKEAGIKFYAKDERGKFRPVDQPKPEPSYI